MALLAVKGRGRSREEERIFRTWLMLIENYDRRKRGREQRLYLLPPKDRLKRLMAEHGLGPASFEPEISRSQIAEILSGNRSISNTQAGLLGQRFRLRAAAFLKLQ